MDKIPFALLVAMLASCQANPELENQKKGSGQQVMLTAGLSVSALQQNPEKTIKVQ